MAWDKEAADFIRSEREAHTIATERFVIEDRLRKHLAPRLWAELRDYLQKCCEEVNKDLRRSVFVFELWPQSQAVIRRVDTRKTLRIEYDPSTQIISYASPSDSGKYRFLVHPDSTVTLGTDSEVPYSIEDVGKRLLNLLLYS